MWVCEGHPRKVFRMFAYQELDRKKARRAICPVSGNSVGCRVCQDPDRETLSLHEIPSTAAGHTHAVFWRARARWHILANEPEWTTWQQINGENFQLTSEWELQHRPACLRTSPWPRGWASWLGARISSACQWDTALLMGLESMCVDLPQAHPHPLAHAGPCQSIVWRPVTVRKWRHVLELGMWKWHPRELFFLVQIGLIGLLPCIVSTGLKGEVEGTVEPLGKCSFNGFFSAIKMEKISNCGRENDPRGYELQHARNPLSWHGKCFMCC